jgi:CheY-like chemotaxis protein
VVANLLTNASKYSDADTRIDVRAQKEGDRVRLSVKDEGLGIVPEMLDRIFDAFTQQNQTLARSEGGLGLGLTIVRTLVELHGGKVGARSDGAGQGSEFIVELPLVEARPKMNRPVDDARRAAAASARIVVIDDNVDAALSLAALLRALGHEVETAHDAPGAIAVAETFRPQVALLDIGLPVMDGYDLARELRAVSGDRPLHLVAVTGYGLAPDRQRSREAGFIEHLVKPVDRKELQALLERLQGRAGRAPRQGLSRDEAAGATRASD